MNIRKSIYIFIVFIIAGGSLFASGLDWGLSWKRLLHTSCWIQEPIWDMCEAIYTGVAFDKDKNICEEVVWGWCRRPPFKTIDECKDVCE